MIMPVLYIVTTPIGNLADITLRALQILKEVSLIATEDTRKTRRLLAAYDIKTPMTSYFEHNKLTKLRYILEQLSKGDVALVSEAGVPGISDPGYELIKEAIARQIKVVPVPGVSAITAALVVSGLPTDRFLFIGFLPRAIKARQRLLKELVNEKSTIIAYEAPHRLVASLDDMLKVLGNRRIAVCRELTKIHEEIFRGQISDALDHFMKPRGEFTLVIEGAVDETKNVSTKDLETMVRGMRKSGKTAREAIGILSQQTGLSRKELYRAWLKQK
jgi:16S rRNA (cytidine1402-2'-O)-methyltransferase